MSDAATPITNEMANPPHCDRDKLVCPLARWSDTNIARMRAALEFYADPVAWKEKHDPDNSVQIPDFYSETNFADMAIEALTTKAG